MSETTSPTRHKISLLNNYALMCWWIRIGRSHLPYTIKALQIISSRAFFYYHSALQTSWLPDRICKSNAFVNYLSYYLVRRLREMLWWSGLIGIIRLRYLWQSSIWFFNFRHRTRCLSLRIPSRDHCDIQRWIFFIVMLAGNVCLSQQAKCSKSRDSQIHYMGIWSPTAGSATTENQKIIHVH